MAKRENPYSLRVELNTETDTVEVTVREKVNGDFTPVSSSVFDLSGVDVNIMTQVSLYGLSKLLQDRSSDVSAGPDKLSAMQEVYDQLAAGQWERERKAGAPTVSAEIEALAQIKGASVADIQKTLRKFTKEQKEKILSNAEVKALADRIRESRSEEDVDLSAML
jgi:HAMP domain-containing protein